MAGFVPRGSYYGPPRFYQRLQKGTTAEFFTGDVILTCSQALGGREVLVNLVNLIDHRSIGVPVIRFQTYRAFHTYTINGCTYPRKEAKKEGFIKALLRKL